MALPLRVGRCWPRLTLSTPAAHACLPSQPSRSFAAPNQPNAKADATQRTNMRTEQTMNELYMRALEPRIPERCVWTRGERRRVLHVRAP